MTDLSRRCAHAARAQRLHAGDREVARQALRQATRAGHVRLEGALSLASPGLGFTDYVATLRTFHAVYAALEAQIDPLEAELERVGFDWPAHRRASILARDLVVLGSRPGRTPSLFRPPRLETLPRVLGCLYVLEGSRLGSRVIRQNLFERFELGPDRGASFFHLDAADLAGRWEAFCAVLERALVDTGALHAASEAATATFEFFYESVVELEPVRASA